MNESEIKEKVLSKLREVLDPELNVDIVSLGLIREIKFNDLEIIIKFLPTSVYCPYLPILIETIEGKIKELGLKVRIEVDFESQWSLDMVSEEVRKKLGFD